MQKTKQAEKTHSNYNKFWIFSFSSNLNPKLFSNTNREITIFCCYLVLYEVMYVLYISFKNY